MRTIRPFWIVPIFFMFLATQASAEDSCPCPPIHFLVYTTAHLTFPLDSTASAVDAGKYVEAENSGSWLDGQLTKQESDEFKVSDAGMQPGASQVPPPWTTYTEPNPYGDYDSWVTVNRTGSAPNYSYNVQVTVEDAKDQTIIVSQSYPCDDLGQVDEKIEHILTLWGPMLDVIRDYQKKIRESSHFEKLISAKWKIDPAHTSIKIHEMTPVTLSFFDCDGAPIPNKKVKLKVLEPSIGSLSQTTVTTDRDGKATVTFTAASKPGAAHIIANYLFTTVTHKTTAEATRCGDNNVVYVSVPYLLSVKIGFKMKGEGSPPGWVEYHIAGKAPVDFQTSPSDPNGTWVFLDDSGITFDQITFQASGPVAYVGPLSYTSPATITLNGSKHILHFDRLGPPAETFEGGGHIVTGGPSSNSLLLSLYNYSNMGEDANLMAGGAKIDRMKQLAAKVEADKAAGKSRAEMAADYQALIKASKSPQMKPMELPGLMFNIPVPMNNNAAIVTDYTVPLDAGPKPKADLIFSNFEIKIEKTS